VLTAIPRDQKISFWTSVKHGFPLLCLLMGDFITISKPSKDGSGMFIDAETYRLLIFGGIYCLSAWVIYLRRVDFPAVMKGHWIYVVFLVYAFSSFMWSANPAKTITTCAHLLGHYLVATAGMLMFRGNEVSVLRVYCLFSYLFIPACLVAGVFFPERNIHTTTGRWTGLTWNPNALGSAAMICVWANISYLLYCEKHLMRLLIVISIVGASILLVGAGSVSSLGLSIFILAGVPLFYWFAGSRDIVTAGLKMGYTALLLFGVGGYFFATQPELFQVDRLLGSVGRDSNLTGRTSLWAIANAAIQDKPWLGWSFDALQSLPSKYSIKYNQFHNGYLDLWVRGGMVALAFIAIFAGTTALRLIRLAPAKKAMSASFGALLIAILLNNASEASLASAPNPLWLLFTFLYIGASPRMVKWYETGVLDEVRILGWRRSSKARAAHAAPPAMQSVVLPQRAPGARSRLRV
jgi:exopolysaccharide production protein ExoQ